MVDYICLQRIDKRRKAMNDYKLGAIETKFACIIWDRAPITTAELIKLAASELGWKRTTTYTVLKRLSEKGIFVCEGGIVRTVIEKDDFYSSKSEEIVRESFGGSLPAFIAAFTSKQRLSDKEIEEIRDIIEKMKKG